MTRMTWKNPAENRLGDWNRTDFGIRAPPVFGRRCGWRAVPSSYVVSLQWTPNVERWEIGLDACTAGESRDDLRIAVRLSCDDRVLTDDVYTVVGSEVHRRIGLSDPGIDDFRNELLWSPETPTLIEARISFLRGEVAIDEIESYTALRSIGVQREKILLNGRPYNMRLVLDQGYWPNSLMTPPSDEALRKDVELAKAMGLMGYANTGRLRTLDIYTGQTWRPDTHACALWPRSQASGGRRSAMVRGPDTHVGRISASRATYLFVRVWRHRISQRRRQA
jgi:hypothetical protein